MEKTIKYNRAPLVAAVLVITGATAIFGTYANNDVDNPQAQVTLTEEQKAGLEEARELFRDGDKDGAKAILDGLGLENLEQKFHFHQKRHAFMEDLTDEQKEGMKQAREMFEAGDEEGAKALLESLNIELPEKLELRLNLTEEQKAKLEEAKALREAGDMEGARAIMEELGLPEMGKFHFGHNMAFMKDLTEEEQARLKEAHELMMNGDEEGAKAIFDELEIPMPQMDFLKDLTDEQRAAMEKAHELMEAGDPEGAKALMEEAGIEMPRGPHFIMKRMELTDEQKETLEQARELREAGDDEAAKALLESADLPIMEGRHMMKFRWMEKGEATES